MIDKAFKYLIDKEIIFYVGIILSILTYSFWSFFPKGFFYIGNALSIFLIAFHFFFKEKTSAVLIFLAITSNNLLDELFFDNTKLGFNEVLFGFIILMYVILSRIFKRD